MTTAELEQESWAIAHDWCLALASGSYSEALRLELALADCRRAWYQQLMEAI